CIRLVNKEIRDLPRPHFAALIGLPELSANCVEACQPSFAIGPGIDANRVAEVDRIAASLLRVSTYHDLAGHMRARVIEFVPEDDLRALLAQRPIGLDVAMNEEMRLELAQVHQLVFEEIPMMLRHVAEFARFSGLAIGCKRLQPAKHQPGLGTAIV